MAPKPTADNTPIVDNHLLFNAQLKALQNIPGVVVRDFRSIVQDYLEVVEGEIRCKVVLPAADFLQKSIVDSFVQGHWGLYLPVMVACRDLEEHENFNKLILPYAMEWWDAQDMLSITKQQGRYTVYQNELPLVENASSLEDAIVGAFKATHIPSN